MTAMVNSSDGFGYRTSVNAAGVVSYSVLNEVAGVIAPQSYVG